VARQHCVAPTRAGTLAALVALVALGGCSTARSRVAGDPVARAARVRGVVALTGDSLTVAELGSLPRAATARGIRLAITAQVGRTTAEGTEALKGIYAPADPRPDVVVVALGTNDATVDLTASRADELIDATMAVPDTDTPVLWLSIYRDPRSAQGDAVDRFNLALRRATARHPNLSVADWRAYIVGHLDLMAADGVHLTDAGYVARTDWLVGVVAARLPAA
jgi:lysophospholipase L1-like esterase